MEQKHMLITFLAGVQVTLEDALKVIENNRKEVK